MHFLVGISQGDSCIFLLFWLRKHLIIKMVDLANDAFLCRFYSAAIVQATFDDAFSSISSNNSTNLRT